MTTDQIKALIDAARAAYQAKAHQAESVWRPLSNKVKELQKMLSDTIADGANPCRDCGELPLGMERTVQVGRSSTVNVFEVGCSGNCQAHISVDGSREKAVAGWNERFGKEVVTH